MAVALLCSLLAAGVSMPRFDRSAVAAPSVYTLFPSSARPQVAASGASKSVELGVRFTARVKGYAVGVRFFKGKGNSGVHVGTLWSAQKQVLARVTFTRESATGWQDARFSKKVALVAGAVYVVSYHAPRGHFAFSTAYFDAAQRTTMLAAPQSTTTRGNGLYSNAASSAFPTNSLYATNYWVDLDFVPQAVSVPEPTTAPQPTSGPTTTTATTPPKSTTVPTTTTVPKTTTTVPATTTTTTIPPVVGPGVPASPPALICGNNALLNGPASPPAGAVVVPAGDNSGGIGQNWKILPNTTYYLQTGVHTLGTGQFGQIVPSNNDTFIGAPGAVIDGQGVNQAAFAQKATDVIIENLEIRGFDAPTNQGVVNHDSGDNWTITHDYIHDNHGAALMTGSNNVITYNCLDHNGQYGINAAADPPPANLLVDHNEISRNDTDDLEAQIPGCGCSGGVKFWEVTDATVTNNYIHNNTNVGLWADTNNAGFNISHNWITNSTAMGIIYEISYNFSITNNYIAGNDWGYGPTNPGFPNAAVYISESGGDSRVGSLYAQSSVSNNTFVDNWGGVTLWENANRYCGTGNELSLGVCTLVNPTVATVAACKTSLLAVTPYINDCRWKTQNVAVSGNSFSLTPANVPHCTATGECGLIALLSQSGGCPGACSAGDPFSGALVEDNITYHQNNHFLNNTYAGPWHFNVHEQNGTSVSFATWQSAPYSQDAGSTLTP